MEIRRPDDAGRGARLADLAHTGKVRGIAEPRAAISLGHKDRIEAERVDRVDIVPGELGRAVVMLGIGCDPVTGEALDAFEDLRLLVRQRRHRIKAIEELHGARALPPANLSPIAE